MTNKVTILTLIFLSCFVQIRCDCDTKYVTFCDCVTDLQNYKTENWTDVIIDSTTRFCTSSTIDPTSFESLEEIKLLIVANYTDSIRENTFNTVGQTLKILKFYGNNLGDIRRSTFSGFRKLSRLSLNNNHIRSIEAFAFSGSVIKNLDLSNNQLDTILEGTFRGSKISRISIRHNKLSYINDDAFAENLQGLQLDNNNLEYIQKGFISKLPRLKELTISHNKLSHISNVRSLENLNKLDFSFNNINFVNAAELEDLKELTYLDLSSNKLEVFPLRALKKIKAPRLALLLSYNLLTNVQITNDVKPMTLTLFGNPWNCKCLEEMEQNMILYNFTTTKCDSELLKSGVFPICVEQGECRSEPVEIREDLRRFVNVVNMKKENLSCDLFSQVRPKHIASVRTA